MKGLLKKGISFILCFSLLFGSYSFAQTTRDYNNHWAYQTIEKSREKGIIDLTPNGLFLPNKKISRAEAVKIINKTFGFTDKKSTPFKDISNHWAKEEIEIAYGAGYIKGTSEESFSPEAEVSREQQAVMLYRAFDFEPEKPEKELKDWNQISDWAKEAVGTLLVKGIFKGYPNGEFRPKAPMTKAEAVVVAMSSQNTYEDKKASEIAVKNNKKKSDSVTQSYSYNGSDTIGGTTVLPNPPVNIDNTNPMSMRKIGEGFFTVRVNQGEDLAKIRQDILKNYVQIKNEDLYLGKIYRDEKQVLAYIEKGEVDFPKGTAKNEIEGIYVADEHHDLKLLNLNQDTIEHPELIMVVGKVEMDSPIAVGKKIIGYPTNSLNVGLDLSVATSMVQGLHLELEKTPDQGLIQKSAISQSGSLTDMPENLSIVNNTIHLGESTVAAKSGIRIKIPVHSGELRIENNQIIGSGNIKDISKSAEAISLITRAKADTKVIIKNNHIKDYKFNGIGVSAGKDAEVEIIKNHLENIGQNGIGVFVFDSMKDLKITENKIDSFGTKEIIGGAYGAEPKVTADMETGISLEYIDMVYGVKVNQRYYNSKDKLIQDLQLVDNKVATKEKNDQLAGVLNCTPVYIGQRAKFRDPVEALNGRGRLSRKDVIVVKDQDEELALGVNPSDPTAKKQVKSLRIVGNGSGRVVLSENLEILEDLIIDLPNASLQNKAKVKGKIQIINIRSNDLSAFHLNVDTEKIFRSSSQPITVLVEAIMNEKGQPITPEKSNLKENLVIKVGDVELEKDNYDVIDDEDKIVIHKEYLDTLSRTSDFVVVYQDEANHVQKVQKNFTVIVEDLSSGELAFVSEKDQSIICAFAPEEGIQIKVNNLLNTTGQNVSPEQSQLNGNIKLKISYLKVDDSQFELDEVHDIITIKKEFLNTVPTPYGKTQTIVAEISDATNNIGKIQISLDLKVMNHSIDEGEVAALTPLTFTEGTASQAGISFQISNLKNARGDILSASDTDLSHYLNIETFPVDWQLEMVGGGEGIHFNPDHYTIDDEQDIITLKKSYLDMIKSNARDTEFGIKQYIFKYRDARYGTEYRSKKNYVYIKKQILPLNKNVTISSSELNINEKEITSGTKQLNSQISIETLLKSIERGNPRQTLRVYSHNEIVEGNLPVENIYHYKNEYENIEDGDILVVTAEDGETMDYYAIHFNEETKESLVIGITNQEVVLQMGGNFIKINGEQTVESVLNSINCQVDVEKTILDGDTPVAMGSNVVENMILQLKKGEQIENRRIQVLRASVYRALIVANSDYPGDKSDLVGPVGDARLMKQVFSAQRYDGKAMVSVTVKENQEKSQFFESIKTAFAGANENDISYLYYSGHGYNDQGMSYLCMVGAALGEEDPVNLWVSVDELKAALDQVPGKKVLILDSCNSGGFIGKNAIDANSGATPKPRNNSREFVAGVMRNLADGQPKEQNTPEYLISDKYKVLAASSENEYSYEDKLEKIGKFTKVLSQAAGIDGELRADKNHDQKASLEELYDYLDRNVIYTSHIQAYPRKDRFTIFEHPEVPAPLSDDVSVTTNADAYDVMVRDSSRMIKSKQISIDENMTVADFLSHIEKGEEHQQLYVIPTIVESDSNHAKGDEAKLQKLDRLLVIAESGQKATYIIVVKKASEPQPPVGALAVPEFNGAYQCNSESKEISSGKEEITIELTVGEFIGKLVNQDQFEQVKINNPKQILGSKTNEQKLEEGDILYLKKGISEESYAIRIKAATSGKILPDFDGKYNLSFNQKSIINGTEKLTSEKTVGEFLEELINRSSYDEVKVLKAYQNDQVKTEEMKLENEDQLFLKKGEAKQQYRLQVEENGGTGPIIIIPED